jgi:hypothetical protein
MQAHRGSGSYRVQSSSTWSPFTKCPTNDKIRDFLYGNEETRLQGIPPLHYLQCVYMQGTPENPVRHQPGGMHGDLLFTDADPDNDFFGPGGELAVLVGGQGGGGGGTRIDSLNHKIWSADKLGNPASPFVPYYPALLFNNIYWSPTLFDSKGGGGGGGGGAVRILSFGDLVVTPTGHITAAGGSGRGGEIVGNSNFSGGGGGGSGGAIVLQAAGEIRIEADADNLMPWFIDNSGAEGASLEVSGGEGWDAATSPADTSSSQPASREWTRSDGGPGGFGLIQLQAGSGEGMPIVEQGAFLFARQPGILKLGLWNHTSNQQKEHPAWSGNNMPPDELRYIDMLHFRTFRFEPGGGGVPAGPVVPWFIVNGADPPIITPDPAGPYGPYQLDTPMIDHYGRRVVREPEPERVMKVYSGWNPETFKEINDPDTGVPGEVYLPTDEIPYSIYMTEPDGTPPRGTRTTPIRGASSIRAT